MQICTICHSNRSVPYSIPCNNLFCRYASKETLCFHPMVSDLGHRSFQKQICPIHWNVIMIFWRSSSTSPEYLPAKCMVVFLRQIVKIHNQQLVDTHLAEVCTNDYVAKVRFTLCCCWMQVFASIPSASACIWCNYPIGSMYGIYTYIYHTNQLNVGKYAIHGSYGYVDSLLYVCAVRLSRLLQFEFS